MASTGIAGRTIQSPLWRCSRWPSGTGPGSGPSRSLGVGPLSVQLNHTIIGCRDKRETAEFWSDILGLELGEPFGPFIPINADNGVGLDFANVPEHLRDDIQPQHYAFLVSEAEFDTGFGKIKQRGLTYWADPQRRHENQINHNDGGRGVYFEDPNGHYMELLTVPYGGWPT